MSQITLIKQGTNICIYNVIDENGNHLPSIDIEVGEDILNSTEYFDVFNGEMVVEYDVVDDAIYEYMESNYPNVIKFEFTIDE
jgi:hypothetical protein